jgi:NitT/TauT family transport system substrate-binding protein
MGVKTFTSQGKKLDAVYLVDHALGIKLFANAAFYSMGGKDTKKSDVVPFLLKRDAEAFAAKNGGKLATYDGVLKTIDINP